MKLVGRVGAQSQLELCSLRVFVDEAAEDRSSFDLRARPPVDRDNLVRWLLGERPMWTVLIVVKGVFGQDGQQVPLAKDQQSVGAFPVDGADPALGMGIGPRRLRLRRR